MSIGTQLADRTVQEIEELWQKAENNIGQTQHPGMSYEDGIIETLRWLWEDGDNPLPDQ